MVWALYTEQYLPLNPHCFVFAGKVRVSIVRQFKECCTVACPTPPLLIQDYCRHCSLPLSQGIDLAPSSIPACMAVPPTTSRLTRLAALSPVPRRRHPPTTGFLASPASAVLWIFSGPLASAVLSAPGFSVSGQIRTFCFYANNAQCISTLLFVKQTRGSWFQMSSGSFKIRSIFVQNSFKFVQNSFKIHIEFRNAEHEFRRINEFTSTNLDFGLNSLFLSSGSLL
jgi:hypothetical protein